jgi:hypothetical protein
MMIAVLMILIFLCVLIVPLRGPSKNINAKFTRPINLSKYMVNKDGWLEKMNEHKEQER